MKRLFRWTTPAQRQQALDLVTKAWDLCDRYEDRPGAADDGWRDDLVGVMSNADFILVVRITFVLFLFLACVPPPPVVEALMAGAPDNGRYYYDDGEDDEEDEDDDEDGEDDDASTEYPVARVHGPEKPKHRMTAATDRAASTSRAVDAVVARAGQLAECSKGDVRAWVRTFSAHRLALAWLTSRCVERSGVSHDTNTPVCLRSTLMRRLLRPRRPPALRQSSRASVAARADGSTAVWSGSARRRHRRRRIVARRQRSAEGRDGRGGCSGSTESVSSSRRRRWRLAGALSSSCQCARL